MNKKNQTNKKVNGDTSIMRFVCDNWDEPTVKVESKGRGLLPARKVVTRGVVRIGATDLLRDVRENLRKGFEVRLVLNTEDAVRFIPMMDSKKTDKMLVNARAMGGFREGTLADKKARFTRCGNDVSYEAVKAFVEKKKAEIPDGGECVTPDTMVKCPKCGYSFRVGRRLEA